MLCSKLLVCGKYVIESIFLGTEVEKGRKFYEISSI